MTPNDFNLLCSLVKQIDAQNNQEVIPPNNIPEITNLLKEVSTKLDTLVEHTKKLWQVILIINKDSINIEEAAIYTSISKSELYHKTAKKEIEFSKPVKQVFFRKKALDEFLKSNNIKIKEETQPTKNRKSRLLPA